jgi:hypothetical protein
MAKTMKITDVVKLIEEISPLVESSSRDLAEIKELQERVKPYLAKLKEISTAIDSLESYDPDETFSIHGKRYQVEAGIREHTREIVDVQKILSILGTEVFMSICKVALKDVDDHFGRKEQEEYGIVRTNRTVRRIKISKYSPSS